MAKEFNKKFMHPTRRKIVDMVLHGKDYEKNAFISLSGTEAKQKREVGEVWEDSDGSKWEQKEYGKVKITEHGDTMAEVRAYLDKLNTCKSEDCRTIKPGRVDKKLISKTGYCLHCLTKREAIIKYDGLWKEYEDYKIYSNMISHGNELVSQFEQAYKDVKQEYEYIHEDGRIEKWVLERDAEEMKAEILNDIENYKTEIEMARKLRDTAWEKLKDKNYDLVRAPKD